jgi:hypothetical protein
MISFKKELYNQLFFFQGPLINSKQFDRVKSMVSEAVGKGAQVIYYVYLSSLKYLKYLSSVT